MNEIMKIVKLYMLMPFVFAVGVCFQNSAFVYVRNFNYILWNFENLGCVIFNGVVCDISVLFNYDACAMI